MAESGLLMMVGWVDWPEEEVTRATPMLEPGLGMTLGGGVDLPSSMAIFSRSLVRSSSFSLTSASLRMASSSSSFFSALVLLL
jgi:hypothetical protein